MLSYLNNLRCCLILAEAGEIVPAECKFEEQGFVLLFFQCAGPKARLCRFQIQATSPRRLPEQMRNSRQDIFVSSRRTYGPTFPARRKYHRCDRKVVGRNSFVNCVSRGDRSAQLLQMRPLVHRAQYVATSAAVPARSAMGTTDGSFRYPGYLSPCQAISSPMARRPSRFTGTALETSPPLDNGFVEE